MSEVGPLLASALIFVAITAAFYADLAARVPALNTSSASVRLEIAPLNRPLEGTPADRKDAAREASTVPFQRAMLISAGLLLCGTLINALGLRTQPAVKGIRILAAHPHWRRSCMLCHRTEHAAPTVARGDQTRPHLSANA